MLMDWVGWRSLIREQIEREVETGMEVDEEEGGEGEH